MHYKCSLGREFTSILHNPHSQLNGDLIAKDDAFKIVAADGHEKQIASQQIPFSDFRFDIATLWLENGCLIHVPG